MNSDSRFKRILVAVLFILFAAIAFGLVWFFFMGPAAPVGFGWYLFSFAAGLSMIVLPCTLPLAFVIVPLSMGKGVAKGFFIALFFGLGVAITLSLYGVFAAVLGKVAIGTLGAPLEVVKNWLYFIAGAFAYLFALGELGLVNLRMPTYTGAFPGFIQKQQDVLKALLLGLFLGNIGVGCPHPATPMILTRIAVAGDVFYGWLLFFVHAVGRVLPLIFLAILGIVGVNALSGLVKHKEKIERATGWGMVFVAGFILVLGLFSHDWWVVSGQHTFLEEITQEETFLNVISSRLGVAPAHEHGLPPASNTGLFGLRLTWGTWVLLFLWILPLWWHWSRKKKALEVLPDAEKSGAKQNLRSLFWNFVTLSVLLVAVFGYVLPQRFLARAEGNHMMEMDGMMEHMNMTPEEMQEHMMGDDHEHASDGGDVHAGHGTTAYHEEGDVKDGIAVNLNVTPPLPAAGESAKFDFFVNLKPGNIPVPESALEIQHEKKMHVIGVRKDLNEFFHIHPELKAPENALQDIDSLPGTADQERLPIFTVTHLFDHPGEYTIWSEIKYEDTSHVFGHPLVNVQGEGPTFELEKEITTNKIIDRYQVGISYEQASVGENHIDFLVRDLEGRRVPLEKYLGEKMHLAVISEDLRQFIHTHPSAEGASEEDHSHSILRIPQAFAHGAVSDESKAGEDDHIGFAVTFQKPGFYKAFVQFRPADANLGPDESLTAEFWIQAEDAPAAAVPLFSSWWRRLFVSLILIALLSWGVKRYLTVRA